MIKEFNRNEVRLHLAKEYPYASQCFAEDFVNKEVIPHLEVSNWFQKYFPSPTGSNLFKQMEFVFGKK